MTAAAQPATKHNNTGALALRPRLESPARFSLVCGARLEQKLWQAIAAIEGETEMRYVTSVESLAIQGGRLEGTAHGIEQALTIGNLA